MSKWELNKARSDGQEPIFPTLVEGKQTEANWLHNSQEKMAMQHNKPDLNRAQHGGNNAPGFGGAKTSDGNSVLPSFLTYARKCNYAHSYPKGIPRSFLTKQQLQAQTSSMSTFGINDPSPNPWKQVGGQSNQVETDKEFNDPMDRQQYSPSAEDRDHERQDSSSPDLQSQKRLSAFQRLGPLSQPKKPKLTINLLCDKEQSVREVVNNTVDDNKYTPAHLRKDVVESTDSVVKSYLPLWPWKKNIALRKSVTARSSKSVMLLEQEQMEEIYEKDNAFIQVAVIGHPPSWCKEDVMDALLDNVRGKSFIPCFIDFKKDECKFLVLKCRPALLAIHKLGFYLRKDDVELKVTISQTDLQVKHFDFIPRLIIRKKLAQGYDGERKLSLKEFTIANDISYFIYFPLHRLTNQNELINMQSTIVWNYLTDLDLSHNRIVSIDGFDLASNTPRLRNLDLSYNCIEKISSLLSCKGLAILSLNLEGNPVCRDYLDPREYVKVVKMIFNGLVELDGVRLHLKGSMPTFHRNFCLHGAENVVNQFLDIFFPLLESSQERARIEPLYDEKAVLTITYRYSLRYRSVHRNLRNLFIRARILEEGDDQSVEGAPSIAKVLCKWPNIVHDPYSFTVDVLHHSDTSTIIRIGGLAKQSSENLADDDQIISFTRTVVLITKDGVEYKIKHEMIYWDEPTEEQINKAFRINAVKIPAISSLKIDSPCENTKEQLLKILMQITGSERTICERCLTAKDWDIKSALEHFLKFVKLDQLDALKQVTPSNSK